MKEEDIRLVVQMTADYTTESHNLGKRTYRQGGCYQVCSVMFEELMASGDAMSIDPRHAPQPAVIDREQVEVVPLVSRWFTANGHDTHALTAGEPKAVPSNLAVFLVINGYAKAA